jgi:hypothetical protein
MNILSKKIMLGTVGLVIAAGTIVAGENLVKNGGAEDAAAVKKWHISLSQNTEDKTGGKASFQGEAKNIFASSQLIEIDPSKAYQLSGSFKSIGKDKGKCYLGFMLFNAKKRGIGLANVISQKGSSTELAADAKAGDKVLKLKNCSKWNKKLIPRTVIAFNTKEDYSDLPNYNLSKSAVKLEQKGGIYEVTLSSPIKKAFPAGTKVRAHLNYGGYQYCAASNKTVPGEWKKYSATVKGMEKTTNSNTKFWPGTKFVKVIAIINYGKKKDQDTKTLFDDIILTEVE